MSDAIRSMTNDTARAVEALKPLMDYLNVDIEADEKRLYMGGQAIGISCNSTWATLMEAIGWLFLQKYVPDRERYNKVLTPEGKRKIKEFWMSKADVERQNLAYENLRLKKELAQKEQLLAEKERA